MFRFFRAIEAAYKTYQQPDSFSKGEGFEAFVEEVLFPSYDYDLVQRTSSFQDNRRRYSEHSLQPDLLFRDRKQEDSFLWSASTETLNMRKRQLNGKSQIY